MLTALAAMSGSMLATNNPKHPYKKLLLSLHGLGLVIVFVAGFGLLARLNIISGFPFWVWTKIIVWIVVGAIPVFIYRFPMGAQIMLFLTPVLFSLNAYFAINKPMPSPSQITIDSIEPPLEESYLFDNEEDN